MCPLIAFPTCHPHPFESSSISIRTAVYPSMQITQFPASCYFVCHTSQKNCYQHAFRAWVPETRGGTDFAANPPFYRWSLRFGSFWRQTGAPQGHPYPPVKSKYLNGISSFPLVNNNKVLLVGVPSIYINVNVYRRVTTVNPMVDSLASFQHIGVVEPTGD